MSARHIAVFVLFSLICHPSATRGAVTAWTAVVVRVYDANGVMAGTNRQALDHARKALDAASIDVIWQMCPASPSCDAPMAPGELAIRIVRAQGPPSDTGTLPLGDATIDGRAGTGVLATVYVDRVEWLAHKAGADSRALLGRAIAHELGHLLLATTTHGPVGLMRAYWSQDEVRRGRARDWRFAPTELAAMRRRAEARERDTRLAWGTR
ncbi:MAG TPA: hypothetical protein VLB75_04935 [Steroidobacteraceae bacterium]|nr:hypothetical protein [Steroidobacteraceae bacterium]